MPLKLPYLFTSAKDKRQIMIDTALEDAFFKPVVHDLIDFGYDMTFPFFGGAGAYQPHTLATEPLDTPEKQKAFSYGFETKVAEGAFKTRIKLTAWFGRGGNVHSFLHELMHFYQDTLGLYLTPLKEQGGLPIMADLRTSVASLLFCEAWAQVEALRSCWSLKHKEIDDTPWKGALASPDWGDLARFYEERLQENRGEGVAAASTFEEWYKGKHRAFYERQALKIYDSEFVRLTGDVDDALITDGAIKGHFRSVLISGLLKKLPQGIVPKYFDRVDLKNAAFNVPQNELVLHRCDEEHKRYGVIENDAIHEIKVASPPYLWKRLREAEIADSQVPPQSTMEFEHGELGKQVG